MREIEILAPAGSFESLVAAVRCGANAVYLGGKAMNARRNATNFDDEEIVKAIDYCHKRNVKVYITVNTLVSDLELDDALKEIQKLCAFGADALIVQDLGLAAKIHELCPQMPLHGSTQMSVQSVNGIRFLENIGFSRVVLPRELSKKEIQIISEQTDMELEYFVHGALCMCMSGQCLMSSIIGERSGNRGLCAQPCRLPFGINGKGGNNLSLKDMSLIERIPELIESGICSLKIEGRMKRPEYVAAAVTACKNSVNNIKDEKITKSLGAVFSRSGFTSGYFDGRLGKDMFGIRTKEDVENASQVLSELSHLYDNENPLLNISFDLSVKRNQKPVLRVKWNDFEEVVCGENIPEESISREITEEELKSRLSKCGGTQFKVTDIVVKCDSGLFVAASNINALRREAIEKLEARIAGANSKKCLNYEKNFCAHNASQREIYAQFFKPDQIPDNICGIKRVILPIDTDESIIENLNEQGIETAVEIPVNIYSNSDLFMSKLTSLKQAGVKLAVSDNIDGIQMAKDLEMKFATGFGMNVYNTLTLEFLEAQGAQDVLLSCEMNVDSIENLGGKGKRGVVAYGRIPLMVTRNCPVSNKLKCKDCNGNSSIVDRMSVSFPVKCRNGCSYIFNSKPISIRDRNIKIGNIDYELLYFSNETKNECAKIISDYVEGKKICEESTGGLYKRNVL